MGVPPSRFLADSPRPFVARESCESFFKRRFGLGEASRSQRRAASLEPKQTLAGIPPLQFADHAQRIVVSRLAVVHEDEREPRVGLDVARITGMVLEALFAERQRLAKGVVKCRVERGCRR